MKKWFKLMQGGKRKVPQWEWMFDERFYRHEHRREQDETLLQETTTQKAYRAEGETVF
jgi:hypothetical protein